MLLASAAVCTAAAVALEPALGLVLGIAVLLDELARGLVLGIAVLLDELAWEIVVLLGAEMAAAAACAPSPLDEVLLTV
jgi:hypothetical protein